MIPNNHFVATTSDPNSTLSKAEIERRRRARANGALDKLRMFHLSRIPNNQSKMDKVETIDQTVKYLQSIGNEQRKGAEKAAFDGYSDGFQAVRNATASFIYSWCNNESMAGALVAAINATLAGRFDQTFKTLDWLPHVYGNKEAGKSAPPDPAPIPNFGQNGQSTSFMTPTISSPYFCCWNTPPLFDSPAATGVWSNNSSANNSRTLSLSSTLSANDAEPDRNDPSGNDNEFVCVTCGENCQCVRNLPQNDSGCPQ